MRNLRLPIAVFDSGIGSYSIVNAIRQIAPKQDIIYLADRRSFPYGSKTYTDLHKAVSEAILYLQKEYNPEAIIVASNVPSVTMLPTLQALSTIPIYGVFPPIAEALEVSKAKNIGILCVKSLADNPAMLSFIKGSVGDKGTVYVINASELVDKVESGEFIFDKDGVKQAVKQFMDNVLTKHPKVDTFTLSSTHLTWLSLYFTELYPDISFVDPANKIVAALPLNNLGSGKILAIATAGEQKKHSQESFCNMLNTLGIDINVKFLSLLS